MAAYDCQSVSNKRISALNNFAFQPTEKGCGAASNMLQSGSANVSASTMPAESTNTVDYLGILADWEEFELQVDSMFNELQSDIGQDTITGMSESRLALKAQAIRGRTMILATRNVQEAMQFYHRQLADSKARQARNDESQITAKNAGQKSQWTLAQKALWYSLVQEFRGIRRSLFACFHQCLLSLIYASNSDEKGKTLLQRNSLKADSSVRLQLAALGTREHLHGRQTAWSEHGTINRIVKIQIHWFNLPEGLGTNPAK